MLDEHFEFKAILQGLSPSILMVLIDSFLKACSLFDFPLHLVFCFSLNVFLQDFEILLSTFKFVFLDWKSTRLNSSHANISYAVFCLKKKKKTYQHIFSPTSHHAIPSYTNIPVDTLTSHLTSLTSTHPLIHSTL